MIIVRTSALYLLGAEMKCFLCFWMFWSSFSQRLVKATSSTFLLVVVTWTIGRLGVYLYNALVLFLAVVFSFLFLFLKLSYEYITIFCVRLLDKKFIVLWHSSLKGQTSWENMPYVVADYNQVALFFKTILPITEVEGFSSPHG